MPMTSPSPVELEFTIHNKFWNLHTVMVKN